jgi:hypothetical protein
VDAGCREDLAEAVMINQTVQVRANPPLVAHADPRRRGLSSNLRVLRLWEEVSRVWRFAADVRPQKPAAASPNRHIDVTARVSATTLSKCQVDYFRDDAETFLRYRPDVGSPRPLKGAL